MKHIHGVHHIALRASDFARSKAFYTEVLGLTQVAEWDGAAMLDCHDGTCIELFDGKEPAPQGGWIHLAFRTEDCDAAYEAALAAGAQPQTPPKETVIPARPNPIPVRLAFVVGFDGEVIEFFQLH